MLIGNVLSSQRRVFRSGAITIYILDIVQHVRFIPDLPFEPISEHGKRMARKRRVTADVASQVCHIAHNNRKRDRFLELSLALYLCPTLYAFDSYEKSTTKTHGSHTQSQIRIGTATVESRCEITSVTLTTSTVKQVKPRPIVLC